METSLVLTPGQAPTLGDAELLSREAVAKRESDAKKEQLLDGGRAKAAQLTLACIPLREQS
jgi:hypothetical protein